MKSVKIHAVSLGCPKNRVDTERLLGSLLPGSTVVPEIRGADVVLVNTCAFIQPAVEESVRVILETAKTTRRWTKRPILAVTGCLIARYQDELKQALPEVDLWLAIDDQPVWPKRLAEALGRKTSFQGTGRYLSTPKGYAYLKIGEGCDHACRFCIIPKLRGPLCSRPMDHLVAEARELLDQGVKELILVAQDVTAYGRDLDLKNGLLRLLEQLLPLPGLTWLRLLYLYPAGLTKEALTFLGQAGPPLLPYFDVPLQHAHAEILKNMGRPFAADPTKVVDRIRAAVPQAVLRTSFIVGFPGEEDRHFQALKTFIATTRFQNLGVFPYCPEEGTVAATMSRQVSDEVKAARKEELMALQAEISAEHLESLVGEEVTVLVDDIHPEWPGLYVGRIWQQAPEVDGVTYVSGNGVAVGEMVKAKVEEAKTYDLVALV